MQKKSWIVGWLSYSTKVCHPCFQWKITNPPNWLYATTLYYSYTTVFMNNMASILNSHNHHSHPLGCSSQTLNTPLAPSHTAYWRQCVVSIKSSAVAMQLLLEFHICLYDKSTSAVTNLGQSFIVCPFQMEQYTVTWKMFEKHPNLYIVTQHTEDTWKLRINWTRSVTDWSLFQHNHQLNMRIYITTKNSATLLYSGAAEFFTCKRTVAQKLQHKT